MLTLAVALASCGGGRWVKPGAGADAVAADLDECRGLARQAGRHDSDIQADILASRGRDWEQAGTLGLHRDTQAAESQHQTGDVLGACMKLKGYAPE